MFMRPTPFSINTFSRLIRPMRSLMSWVSVSMIFLSVGYAAPVDVNLEEDYEGLHYRISTNSKEDRVKRSDISLSLTDDNEPLHSIEIKNASTKKKWLKSFTDSKNHPYIKGILVRERSGGSVQIRTRFKASPRLPKNYSSKITIEEEDHSIVITLVSPIKAAAKPSVTTVTKDVEVDDKVQAQSEPESKKLDNVRRTTALLKDAPNTLDKGTVESELKVPNPTSTSPFDRGMRPPPNPPQLTNPQTNTVGTLNTPTPVLANDLELNSSYTPKEDIPTVSPSVVENVASAPSFESKPERNQTHSTAQEFDNTQAKHTESKPNEGLFGGEIHAPSERQLMIVALLGMVALLGLFLMRRSGKSPFGSQGEIPFKVRSRQVVNAQWNQEILIVDVLDRTLLLGSSASGGLTLLAQISPDPFVRPEPQGRYQEYSAYPESDDYPSERYEGSYSDERYPNEQNFHESYDAQEYYADQRSPRLDLGHHPQQHEPSLDESDSSYTLEIPMSEMDGIPVQMTSDLTAERSIPIGGFNASTALGGLEALVSEAQSRSSSRASKLSEPEPSSVSADDLLQKIRQLNQG